MTAVASIEMPTNPKFSIGEQACVPMLVRERAVFFTNARITAIIGNEEVLLFISNEDKQIILTCSLEHFRSNYKIIRHYVDGEKLVITR